MLRSIAPRLLYIGLGLELLVILLARVEAGGFDTLFFQAAARLSGRVSLLFFAGVVIHITQHPAVEAGHPEWMTKYLLTRNFAILHVIHWCLLAVAVWRIGFELVPARIAGGALAYALVVLFPLALRKGWFGSGRLALLQNIYLYWVWFVFFMTYLSRLRGQTPVHTGSPAAWWPLSIATIALLLWHFWAKYRPAAVA